MVGHILIKIKCKFYGFSYFILSTIIWEKCNFIEFYMQAVIGIMWIDLKRILLYMRSKGSHITICCRSGETIYLRRHILKIFISQYDVQHNRTRYRGHIYFSCVLNCRGLCFASHNKYNIKSVLGQVILKILFRIIYT